MEEIASTEMIAQQQKHNLYQHESIIMIVQASTSIS